jgi:hypothetical protein
MKLRKPGKRHPLLIYRRAMDRLWQETLILGLILGFLWWQISYAADPLIETEQSPWLLAGSAVALGYTGFALIARRTAYVQTKPNHLVVITPFIRLKIAYRRVHNVRLGNFSALFPPRETGWASRRFLAPFYGQTAVVVDLAGYPLNPHLLRLFFPRQMFVPGTSGFVFLVSDWMAFSLELDSSLEAWRHAQTPRRPTFFNPQG